MVDEQDAQTRLAGPGRAEQAGGPGADDGRVEVGGEAQGASTAATGGGVYFR